MKIDIAYGRDLDVEILKQLQYMQVEAYAFYDSLDSDDTTAFFDDLTLLKSFKQFKQNNRNTIFLFKTKKIKDKHELIAMACLSKFNGNTYQLHTVFVKKDYRRNGIGTALVKHAIREAKKAKFTLQLNVNPLNFDAIMLYSKHGFKICKNQTFKMEI